MERTPEQNEIIEAVKGSNDNLIIRALAGAAKTTTLVMIANELPNIKILALCFNRRIADEMSKRLPANCEARTLNSLGHSVWSECHRRPKITTGKVYGLTKEAVESKEFSRAERKALYDDFADIMKTVELGKSMGWLPGRKQTLVSTEDFYDSLDEAPSPVVAAVLESITETSVHQALDEGIFDFSDQLLLPTLFPAMFPKYDLVLVDEAQDLSPLNHAMLVKLAAKRIIAVGDEFQSIYAFRGADSASMENLQSTFAMRPLGLSVSFRCPRAIVAEALWRAPHMRFPDWAIPGEVQTFGEYAPAAIPDSATILCRNNAPLFGMAIKLLKNGRYPQIVGNDIGKYLIKVLKKLGDNTTSRVGAEIALKCWVIEKLKKSKSHAKVHDQAACIRVFLDATQTIGDAIAYAEHIFARSGPISLMSIHKSKGLEFDHVFILDADLIKHEDDVQESNLKYVAITRSKSTLTYIQSKSFLDN